MAFTVSQLAGSVWGKERVQVLRITADATTQTIQTNLPGIFSYAISAEAMASAPTMNMPVVKINVNASGVAAAGSVGLSNCVSGDIYHLWVIGRS